MDSCLAEKLDVRQVKGYRVMLPLSVEFLTGGFNLNPIKTENVFDWKLAEIHQDV